MTNLFSICRSEAAVEASQYPIVLVNIESIFAPAIQITEEPTTVTPRPEKRPKNDPRNIMALCPRCRAMFFDAHQYFISRVDPLQSDKDRCTYCQKGYGFDYYVTPYDWDKK